MSQNLTSYKTAKYFPLANGKYEVKPGLFSLQHDFGNINQDNYIFQIDNNFSDYRENKLAARNERLSKYYCIDRFPNSHQRCISRFIINSLLHEYPDFFHVSRKTGHHILKCKLTDENILFTDKYELINSSAINYTNLLDAVIMQIQEDIAIIADDDHISCLHLMAPNFWSATDKIGKSFSHIHQEIAGIEKITKNSKTIIQAMIHKGPYVRFAWGITTDNQLNHHPDFNNRDVNSGRYFQALNPELFLRVERQTINGLPEIKSALFTIRSYIYNIEELDKIELQSIINAINSMTAKQLEYKGLKTNKSAIIKWLTALL